MGGCGGRMNMVMMMWIGFDGVGGGGGGRLMMMVVVMMVGGSRG